MVGWLSGFSAPEEDADRQRDALEPHPGEVAVELGLHQRGLRLLQLKCVVQPKREVEEGEAGDRLPTPQRAVLEGY